MANTLLITKQTGNFFSIQLNSETPIISEQNRLTTVGSFCHFKTVSGANIIKEQDILYSDITLIASGTFTFASVNALWVKLVDVGFFNGLGASGGGGGGGADQFTELIDTFNSYIGRDGHALVVNESELKIESVPFANVSKFIDLTDTPNPLLPNKMIVTNSAGNALIMTDLPATPETYLNAVGTFHYADLATQTVPLTIVSNVPKKLENDGLGTYTVLSNAPFGVSSVWNSTTDQLDFSEMSIGDLITLRVDASITTSSANQIVKCYTKLGVGSASVFDLIIAQEQVKTAGVYPFVAEVSFDLAYSDIVNNPAEIYVLSDGNSTITINGWYIEILRKNINISTIEVTGNTNLTTLQTASNVTVQSDTGADAIIPLGNGTLAGVSLNNYTNADKALVSGITGKEDVSNKQNSLATDATNTKYPTVTAVNSGLGGKLNTPTGLTTNFLPKWNGSGFGNSIVSEVGSEVIVNGSGFFVGGIAITPGALTIPSTTASQLFLSCFGADKKLHIGDGTGYNFSFVKKSAGIETIIVKINDIGNSIDVNGTITASPSVNSNQVVVKSQLDAFVPSGTVNLTGNQTIAGVKTFSSPVVVPNGVGATDAVNKSQLDAFVPSGTVNLTGNQTIAGVKTFSSPVVVPNGVGVTDAVNKSQLDLKAGLASPTFTGTPTAPTATAGTNTTQVATTAFVGSAIATSDAGNVKTTGDQFNILGKKSFTSTTGYSIRVSNSSSVDGIQTLSASNGNGIFAEITGTGTSIKSNVTSGNGNGIVSNVSTIATGLNYVGQNNGTNTFTVDKLGAVTATSFIKSGASTTNLLLAGGGDIAQSTFAPAITGLTTNILPKWNGSGFGNSIVSEVGSEVIVNGSGFFVGGIAITPGALTIPSTTASQLFLSCFGADKKLHIGDGTGYNFSFVKKSAGIETIIVKINDIGNSIDVNGTITASPAVNSNQVVVKSQLDAFVPSGTVNLTGNQTIAGVKTFSSPVVVPNGVGVTDAVNKSQLDALASSGSYNASISNASNISGITIGRANYMKIGNVVSVNFSGSATFITTNASVTFEISLPFNKTLTNTSLRAGSAVPVSAGVISTGIIEHITSVSTFRVSINSSPLNGLGTISGSFMYNITD